MRISMSRIWSRISGATVLRPRTSISRHRHKESIWIGAGIRKTGPIGPNLARWRLEPHLVQLVEREIELEHVDPLLAEDAEKPVLGHVGDQRAHFVLREVARLRHSRHLELGGGRGDVGVETAAPT